MIFSPVCSKGIEPADSGGELDFLSTKTNKGANIKKAHNCLLPKENVRSLTRQSYCNCKERVKGKSKWIPAVTVKLYPQSISSNKTTPIIAN